MSFGGFFLCVTLLCSHITLAAPTATKRQWGILNGDIFNSGDGSQSGWDALLLSECSGYDLSQAQLPTASLPTPLPRPTGTLSHIAIGRGTQNYTCDTSDPKATPVPVGALATLYNVSCIAATNSALLSYLPNIAYSIRLRTLPDFFSEGASSSSSSLSSASGLSGFLSGLLNSSPVDLVLNAANGMMSGHHFFVDDDSPRFDLNTANGQLGAITASKVAESDPPSDAAESSVAWLYLKQAGNQADGTQSYSEVYRVNTVGGAPPSTCDQVRWKSFKRQYSAEYWFYK